MKTNDKLACEIKSLIKDLNVIYDGHSERDQCKLNTRIVQFFNKIGHPEAAEAYNKTLDRCMFWYS